MNKIIGLLILLIVIIVIGVATRTNFIENFELKGNKDLPIKNIDDLNINSCENNKESCGYSVARLGFKQNQYLNRQECLNNPFNTFLQHQKLYGPIKVQYTTKNIYESPFFNPLTFSN